ncbi:MAG: hypothetical protein H0U36_10215 [Nocardioidaceae bacterium]|nr:hypothetical protein [Nocardioidaceae bacterium]
MSYQPGPPASYPPPPPGGDPYGYGGDRPAPKRPGTLLAGCIMSWIGSAVGLLLGGVFLAASSNDELLDQMASNVDRADAQTFLQTFGGVLLVWSLLTLVFSILAFIGKRWAAIALVVLGGLWVAFNLYALVTGGEAQGLVGIIWVGVASVLVLIGSKEWFDYKSGRSVTR